MITTNVADLQQQITELQQQLEATRIPPGTMQRIATLLPMGGMVSTYSHGLRLALDTVELLTNRLEAIRPMEFVIRGPVKEIQQVSQIIQTFVNTGTVTSLSRTYPNGSESIIEHVYELADLFDDIRIEEQTDSHIRLVFEPMLEADRYWKDVMVALLARIRNEAGLIPMFVQPASPV